jgi:hypothetical protein
MTTRRCIKSPKAKNVAQKPPGKSAISGLKPGGFIVIFAYSLCNLLFEKTFDTAPCLLTYLFILHKISGFSAENEFLSFYQHAAVTAALSAFGRPHCFSAV